MGRLRIGAGRLRCPGGTKNKGITVWYAKYRLPDGRQVGRCRRGHCILLAHAVGRSRRPGLRMLPASRSFAAVTLPLWGSALLQARRLA